MQQPALPASPSQQELELAGAGCCWLGLRWGCWLLRAVTPLTVHRVCTGVTDRAAGPPGELVGLIMRKEEDAKC